MAGTKLSLDFYNANKIAVEVKGNNTQIRSPSFMAKIKLIILIN